MWYLNSFNNIYQLSQYWPESPSLHILPAQSDMDPFFENRAKSHVLCQGPVNKPVLGHFWAGFQNPRESYIGIKIRNECIYEWFREILCTHYIHHSSLVAKLNTDIKSGLGIVFLELNCWQNKTTCFSSKQLYNVHTFFWRRRKLGWLCQKLLRTIKKTHGKILRQDLFSYPYHQVLFYKSLKIAIWFLTFCLPSFSHFFLAFVLLHFWRCYTMKTGWIDQHCEYHINRKTVAAANGFQLVTNSWPFSEDFTTQWNTSYKTVNFKGNKTSQLHTGASSFEATGLLYSLSIDSILFSHLHRWFW